jgi:hypothetical protein
VVVVFFAVLDLQLSLYSGGCFTCIGLFTEFPCILHHLMQPWNRPDLLVVLFELLVITIACCSVPLDRIQIMFLHLYCILSFGFIVGEPTPVSFLGCLTSSSFRIRSGNNPSCKLSLICLEKKKSFFFFPNLSVKLSQIFHHKNIHTKNKIRSYM